MQTELVTSMMVDTARDALPNIGRIEVAFPETELTLPTVMVRQTFGVQREVGVGQEWSTGEKANIYDVTIQYDIYAEDTLEADQIIDNLTDHIASSRDGMASWTSVLTGESASMIDAVLVGTGDFGFVEEIDSWRKTLTYFVIVAKPQ
jgi:hypothetical protein